MVQYKKRICQSLLLLYGVAGLRYIGKMHFCKLLLVQRSFHANNLTENENVTANPALDCYAIVRD